MINRVWHSSILDARSFRGADCDTDHYLVVTKVRERLAVSKQAAQKFDWERFNLRKLNVLEDWKQYQTEIRDKFAALENLSDGEVIHNIKTSTKESLDLHEMKQHKVWFDDECLGLFK